MDWLSTFLALPNGIPSHDTISRLFAQLDADQLQACFLSWIQTVAQLAAGAVVAVDGKTLRHSYDRGQGNGAIPMVSAWAAENRLVLGQVKVDEKKIIPSPTSFEGYLGSLGPEPRRSGAVDVTL